MKAAGAQTSENRRNILTEHLVCDLRFLLCTSAESGLIGLLVLEFDVWIMFTVAYFVCVRGPRDWAV